MRVGVRVRVRARARVRDRVRLRLRLRLRVSALMTVLPRSVSATASRRPYTPGQG